MSFVDEILTENTEVASMTSSKLNLLNWMKSSLVPVQDVFTYQSGNQIFNLDFEPSRITGVHVNGVKLHPAQFDKLWKSVEIFDVLDAGDYVEVDYEVKADTNSIYGIEWDKTVAAPEVTKIGNMALHASLPVQSEMKRCVVQDDGTVNYYLDENDSTKKADGTVAVLDGTDGQVMVQIPRYWRKSEAKGNNRKILFSAMPIPDAEEIPKMYVSAYKAALNRSANMLSSVLNLTADYRGGSNQGSWDADNEYKSQLGKPVTNKDRFQFRIAAKNRGENWYDMDWQARESIAWLITCEYGTRYHQSAVSEGATNLSGGDWSTFNGRYPLFRCGLTNSLGNNTGEVPVTVQDFPTAGQTVQTQVFSYRGIENFWGDVWEWTNGVNVVNDTFYMTRGKNAHDGSEGYKPIGAVPTPGYITDVHPGTALPSETVGGSSGTYWTDYYYYNGGNAGLLCSGPVYNGAAAGSFIVFTDCAPSYASATIGSRLCFFAR